MHFLDLIVQNRDVFAALLFCMAAGAGQILHAFKKVLEQETTDIFAWFTTNIRHSIASMIGNVAGMIIFIQTGVLGPMMDLPHGWWTVILFGFMNGFGFDSALNKTTQEKVNAEPK